MDIEVKRAVHIFRKFKRRRRLLMTTRAKKNIFRLMASTQDISEKKDEEPTVDPDLIEWEEWALVTEEHFHAQKKWQEDPLGLPMGHRKKKKPKK